MKKICWSKLKNGGVRNVLRNAADKILSPLLMRSTTWYLPPGVSFEKKNILSLSIMFLSFTLSMNQYASFLCVCVLLFFFCRIIFHCMFIPQFVYYLSQNQDLRKMSIFRKLYPFECKSVGVIMSVQSPVRV